MNSIEITNTNLYSLLIYKAQLNQILVMTNSYKDNNTKQ
jgi:hypothetical protein